MKNFICLSLRTVGMVQVCHSVSIQMKMGLDLECVCNCLGIRFSRSDYFHTADEQIPRIPGSISVNGCCFLSGRTGHFASSLTCTMVGYLTSLDLFSFL